MTENWRVQTYYLYFVDVEHRPDISIYDNIQSDDGSLQDS